ncbi:fluoride efflux transporter FluC [Brachybacterium nesterenkovii]|uniref:Fluoride-specific ion channel FluC n=1 Tax=Brachybacterium nesterenkovii TaxID=47847 RepID=A0A1X6WZT8_9MICO|nr:CrcB family protein [Brachybacterium nesterenkovii]SLM91524.1 CrcB protein [Brachybacterium nesterenkovii]
MAAILGLLAVAVGGAAGSTARWGLAHLWAVRGPRREGLSVPWATFAANILACFALGVIVTWFGASAGGAGRTAYLLLATGFCGGLSTLSTLALEVVALVRGGGTVIALGYILLSAGSGMVALWLGLVLAA